MPLTQAKERELELQMIKQQYLGDHKKQKKTGGKPSDKFRFNFEWDASEDTSRDLNPLYQNPHGAEMHRCWCLVVDACVLWLCKCVSVCVVGMQVYECVLFLMWGSSNVSTSPARRFVLQRTDMNCSSVCCECAVNVC